MSELKFIAITDVHGRIKQAEKVAEITRNENINAIILSGDLSRYKSIEEAREVLKTLSRSEAKIFYVPGNMDDPKICDEIKMENVFCVHERNIEYNQLMISGFGGALIGPFHTPFEFTEEQILEKLRQMVSGITYFKLILVTHNPPYNTNADKLSSYEHVGSKSLRIIIENVKPILNVCGHIHEARSIDRIDKTVIVNPGPLMYGYYSKIIIKEEVKVELLRI